MSCERFREAIAGHAAGEDISGAAAAHISSCESCRAEVERRRVLLAEVDAELSRTLAMTASPEFVARVTARAAANAARSIPWRPAAAWVGLAAAGAIAVVLFLRAPGPALSPAPREAAVTAPVPAAPPAVADRIAPPAAGRQPLVRRSEPRPSRRLAAARPRAEPPVMVGPEQARAIARLHELLSEGRLTAKMLPPTTSHQTAELAVVPLEIPEIIVPGVEDVGRAAGAARERQEKE